MSVQYWDAWYHETLVELLNTDATENKRTGEMVRALPCRELTLSPSKLVPVLSTRAMWPKTAAAEVAWMLMGTKDPTWINERCPIWKDFADENGEIEAAYGYRWMHHFGLDQIEEVLHKLEQDPTSRQCYVSTFAPEDLAVPKKNIPCPVGFTINIINDQLHMSVNMRSSDIIAGLPYDVMAYSLLQNAFAKELKVEVGCLQFMFSHIHVYQKHFDIALKMVGNYNDRQADNWETRYYFEAPDFDIYSIQNNPELYYKAVADLTLRTHKYKPKPEIFN